VLAEKGKYQYPFFRVPVDTPFPALLAMEPDRPATTISLDKLRLALRFLAASRKEMDPACRLNICSVMPNQQVGTWNDGVFIQTEGPAVDAPVNLASSDAVRLGQWLHLLHCRGESKLQIRRSSWRQRPTWITAFRFWALTGHSPPNSSPTFKLRKLPFGEPYRGWICE
jgi:hypothetical protein